MDSLHPFQDLPAISSQYSDNSQVHIVNAWAEEFDFVPAQDPNLRYSQGKSPLSGLREGYGSQSPMSRYVNGSDAVPSGFLSHAIPDPHGHHITFDSKIHDSFWRTPYHFSPSSPSESSDSSGGPTYSARSFSEDYDQHYGAQLGTAVPPLFGGGEASWFSCHSMSVPPLDELHQQHQHGSTSCVALQQVQRFEECLEDHAQALTFPPANEVEPDAVYDLIEVATSPSNADDDVPHTPVDPELLGRGDNDTEYLQSTRRNPRRNRRQAPQTRSPHNYMPTPVTQQHTAAPSIPTSSAGISKRKNKTTKANGAPRNRGTAIPSRPFPCPLLPFGCTSTFASKNEWKRHVSTQHVKMAIWRCDLCVPGLDPLNPQYNDFNRKDLFTQHLRRMHPCATDVAGPTAAHANNGVHGAADADNNNNNNNNDHDHDGAMVEPPPLSDEVIAAHQKRCYKILRTAPEESGCLFCEKRFSGLGSWDERMEHVGGHLEKLRRAGQRVPVVAEWIEDAWLRDWLLDEGLIERDGVRGWRIGDGIPRRGEREDGEADEDEDEEG